MLTTVAKLGCVHDLCWGVVPLTIAKSLASTRMEGVVTALWFDCSKYHYNLLVFIDYVNFKVLGFEHVNSKHKSTLYLNVYMVHFLLF
jgi:hypothetical protein